MATGAGDPLLQSLQLRHLKSKNRVMSTSHACGLEERDTLRLCSIL